MDYQSKKVLKFLNKHTKHNFTLSQLWNHFSNIPEDDLIEILLSLRDSGYVKITFDSEFESTNKGKTYFSVNRSKWISEHIIETLAFIVAFVALLVSIVSLFRTL